MSKHLSVEMDHLKKNLLSLTTLVEDVVQMAVQALQEKDKELAKIVIEMDEKIDDKEVEIEEECLKILALHQPVAIDLRYLVGALKMNNDLERIGDLAVNIAERTLFIMRQPEIESPFDLKTMVEKTCAMLKSSIDALINMDTKKAKKVCQDDEEVNQLNRQMYDKVFAAIKLNPENVETLSNYLAASRHLERIADYTTNIAEDVIYMVEGTIVRHSPDIYE